MNLGFLFRTPLLFTVIIKVSFKLLIILFLIARWITLNFMSIIWNSWYMRMLFHLFIAEQMIKSLISLWSLYQKLSLWNFRLWLDFKKLQLWGCSKQVISSFESLEHCANGGWGVLEPKVLVVHHTSGSSRDNKLLDDRRIAKWLTRVEAATE